MNERRITGLLFAICFVIALFANALAQNNAVFPSGSSGGTPGGSNTQFQYNNSSAFGGTAAMTFSSTNSQIVFNPTANCANPVISLGGLGTGFEALAGNLLSICLNGAENWRYQNTSLNGFGVNVILDNTSRVSVKAFGVTLANGLNSDISLGSNLNSAYIRITGPSAGFSIGGFVQGVDGAPLCVNNAVVQAMTIVNEDASSTAANRITTLTGGNIVLAASISNACFIYDISTSRWMLRSARDSSGPK